MNPLGLSGDFTAMQHKLRGIVLSDDEVRKDVMICKESIKFSCTD